MKRRAKEELIAMVVAKKKKKPKMSKRLAKQRAYIEEVGKRRMEKQIAIASRTRPL